VQKLKQVAELKSSSNSESNDILYATFEKRFEWI
jgi:hypothetical protein